MRTKLFLIIVLILNLSETSAQNERSTPIRAKYQGEVIAGFSIGVRGGAHKAVLHTIQGIRIGDYFSSGLGVGLNIIPDDRPEFLMPLYLNLKGLLPVNHKNSLFASFDVGGVIGLGKDSLRKPFFSPALGISLNHKLNISLAYDYILLSSGKRGGDLSSIDEAISLKFGILF